jgi:ribonucleotide reductase alpha subunit
MEWKNISYLDEEKEVFRTFKEINQLEIVRQAGIRQQFVDQTVSLNLCFDLMIHLVGCQKYIKKHIK